TVQQTLSIFMVGVALGQAFCGPMADRWGRRVPLLVGMGVFVVATFGCAQAESMPALLAWRLLMALGCSASMVIPRSVVRDLFDERESARMYALLMLILGVSPILAPTLGGLLLDWTGWRGIFWILAAIGVGSGLAVWRWLPESLPVERRSPVGIRLALKNYATLFADRRFIGASMAAGFTLGSLFAYLSASSFVFIELHGMTAQQYAIVFGFNASGLIGASQLCRWLLKRHTSRAVLTGAFTANAIVGGLLAVAGVTGWGGMPVMIGLLFLMMTGCGFIFPNIAALAMAPFGAMAGSASALLGTVQFALAAASGAAVGSLHNGTALPMAFGVATCTIAGWIVQRTMIR
ncbi:MAG TPA: multidrug effflux MFS transporter, partial [Opitutaceae bacterium]